MEYDRQLDYRSSSRSPSRVAPIMQCVAKAKTTGERCKKESIKDERLCQTHHPNGSYQNWLRTYGVFNTRTEKAKLAAREYFDKMNDE